MAAPGMMTTAEGARGTDGGAMTLSRHILESQRQQPRARGELSVVLLQLAFAGKIFSHALRRSALDGRLGPNGDRNVQGEATKKLDVFGNDTIVGELLRPARTSLDTRCRERPVSNSRLAPADRNRDNCGNRAQRSCSNPLSGPSRPGV